VINDCAILFFQPEVVIIAVFMITGPLIIIPVGVYEIVILKFYSSRICSRVLLYLALKNPLSLFAITGLRTYVRDSFSWIYRALAS